MQSTGTQNRMSNAAADYPELMSIHQAAERFHMLAEDAGEYASSEMADETGLIALLEWIQAEDNWRNIRADLDGIGMFGAVLNEKQRNIALDYLFEMLSRENGVVRRLAASTAGKLLADCDLQKSDIWKNYLHRMLFPGEHIPGRSRRWIGFSLRRVVRTLLEEIPAEQQRAALRTYASYFKSSRWDAVTCRSLLGGIEDVPYTVWSGQQRRLIFDFTRKLLQSDDAETRIACMWHINAWLGQGWDPGTELEDFLRELPGNVSAGTCEHHLRRRIRHHMGVAWLIRTEETYDVKAVMRENLQLESSWLSMRAGLMILGELAHKKKMDLMEYAAHLLQLLRSGGYAVIRIQAGEDLIRAIPLMNQEQRQTVVRELMAAVRRKEERSANYIPAVLGKIFALLPVLEQRDLMPRIETLADSRDAEVACTAMETIGVILRSAEGNHCPTDISERCMNLLCYGMACYNPPVAKESFALAVRYLFGGEGVSGEETSRRLQFMMRRMLILISAEPFDRRDFYLAAPLRSLDECIQKHAEMLTEDLPGKAALFSGSFDPFTDGQKAVVQAAADMGFAVYLNVHDLSWQQHVQPTGIRRRILQMSVADMEHVYLLSEDIPVNPGNPEDLENVRRLFSGRKLYMMAGSDVLLSDEAYLAEPSEGSVHSFPHILFLREEAALGSEDLEGRISGDVLCMQLPQYYDRMTSDEMKRHLQEGRDIAEFVQGQVRNLIYEQDLYGGDILYKKTARTREIDTVRFPASRERGETGIRERIAITDGENGGEVRGTVLYEILEPGAHAGGTAEDGAAAEEVLRDISARTEGRIALIREVTGHVGGTEDMRLTVLTEMLAICHREGCSFALCPAAGEAEEVFLAHGFLPVEGHPEAYLADIRKPLVAMYDTHACIRDPYADVPQVRKVLWESRLKLQRALAGLYPGCLVLHMDMDILNYRLIKMIRAHNLPECGEEFGPRMCVPFGKILKGAAIPQTVTHELFTEKRYEEDLSRFEICEFPRYAPLKTQVRNLRSFGREIILVDDLYHNGYRLDKIAPILAEEQVKVSSFIVGVLSGNGRRLAEEAGRTVEAAMEVPDMRAWIIASEMYPFVGGDGIRTPEPRAEQYLQRPSVNAILPYQVPAFLKGVSAGSLYRLSETCLQNAREIFLALEEVFQERYHRKLTLPRIGEVMAEPRYPAGAVDHLEDHQERISGLLDAELRKLRRFRHLEVLG